MKAVPPILPSRSSPWNLPTIPRNFIPAFLQVFLA
ncbi:MAG: hypothetical protein JWR65_3403 [Massilia sp.]|jgi:hypothetical protein|nr:hypothetical protein [Massilia sp.]